METPVTKMGKTHGIPRNYGMTTEPERKPDGKFAIGNPGRPKGSRHKTTLAIEALLDGEGEALTRKAIDMALAGDSVALRLCLERLAPARKEPVVVFDLPDLETARDGETVLKAILQAVATGELTPSEAGRLGGLLDGWRKARELGEIEDRLAALEDRRLGA